MAQRLSHLGGFMGVKNKNVLTSYQPPPHSASLSANSILSVATCLIRYTLYGVVGDMPSRCFSFSNRTSSQRHTTERPFRVISNMEKACANITTKTPAKPRASPKACLQSFYKSVRSTTCLELVSIFPLEIIIRNGIR